MSDSIGLRYDVRMTDAERVQQWLLDTVRMMVDQPDAVSVELVGTGDQQTFRLDVHPSEIGRIIGKEGRTGRALRTILGAITVASGKRFGLDIAEHDKIANPAQHLAR
jgi:uncharacterized protein